MKTAEQILKDTEKEHGGDITYWQQNWIISAMEKYADQFKYGYSKNCQFEPKVCSKCSETTGQIEDFEYDEQESKCHICGLIYDHSLGCPENNSPFANLIRDGYD